jgi:membrane associated rhomboid family serine protease
MFIPLHDINDLKHIKLQYVTIGLIAVNVLIWLGTSAGGENVAQLASVEYGFIPSTVHDIAERPPELTAVPDWATYLTYAFLHGDFWHIAGNMLFLWTFGDNVEDAMGHVRYLVFYLLCAIAGAFVHGLLVPASEAPLIGASGAIAGIVAAYLLLHPKVKIWILAFGRIPLRIPAWIPLALWIAFQVVMLVMMGEDEVSYAAHVGGALAGAALVLILRRRDVPLFDREVVTPRAVRRIEPQPPREAAAPSGPWGRQ